MKRDALPDARLDALLRRLPAADQTASEPLDVDPPDDGVDDAELLALARGQLPEADVRRLEAILAVDPAARTLAVELARVPDRRFTAWAHARLAPRTLRRWWPAIGLAAAALLAIAIWPGGSAPPALTPYAVSGPLGGVRATMGEAAPSDVFVPTSRVRVVLRPAADLEGDAPALRVFTSLAGGPLTPVEPRHVVRGEGGAWLLDAPGEALFGARPGRYTLSFALAADPDTLADLAGRLPAEARDAKGLQWHHLDLEYRTNPEGDR